MDEDADTDEGGEEGPMPDTVWAVNEVRSFTTLVHCLSRYLFLVPANSPSLTLRVNRPFALSTAQPPT